MELSIRGGQQGQPTKNQDVETLNAFRSMDAGVMTKSETAARVFATESIDEATQTALFNQESNIRSMISSIRSRLNRDMSFGDNDIASVGRVAACESAAVISGFAAAGMQKFVNRGTSLQSIQAGPNTFVIQSDGVPHYEGRRDHRVVAAIEAFDNVQQRNASLYTMAYNYTASLQSEMCETVWPMLTLPADQVGFGIIVNRLTIHRGMTHDVTGKTLEFQKTDLCRAAVDHTVLSRTKNRAIPVYRAAAAPMFAEASVVAPWDYTEEGANYKTCALRTGVEIGYLGLCQTDAQLANGSANQTDTLDPAISLDDLYLKIGNDTVKVNVYGRQGANFTYSQQDREEDRRLNFNSKYIVLSPTTMQPDGSALADLTQLAANNYHLVLNVEMSGKMNTEFGSISAYSNRVSVVRVIDNNMNVLAPTHADVTAIVNLIATARVAGYTVRAYKRNVNLRERGDFIDRTQFTQLYEVPLLSPITAQRPIGSNGEMDASDFETLVTSTRFRMMNDSVTAIFDAVDRIREFCRIPFTNEDAPSGLGAARFHVKPYLGDLTGANAIDVATIVSSPNNIDAAKNVQAAIVNKLRDMAFSMYVMSEYPSAAAALGMTGETTLIIVCDPIVRRYLLVDGDIRTLTDKFNVRIVDTLDARFRGKVFMTFGIFDESRNQSVNILNWGNLVWGPEVVVSTPMPRGESISRETIVQPRYLFVNHLPVAAMVEVKNISHVFDETYLKVQNKVLP